MTGRGVVVTLAVATTLVLAATTQHWVVAVLEPAPGAPRTRTLVAGGQAAPEVAALALLALAACPLALSRTSRWPRLVVLVASVAALVATIATALDPAASVPGEVVASAELTFWVYVALAGTSASAAAGATWCLLSTAPSQESARPRSAGPVPAHEHERRSAAGQWRSLDEGRDPTGGA